MPYRSCFGVHVNKLSSVRREDFGDSKVNKLQCFGVFGRVEEVLWLDVSVTNSSSMQVIDCLHDVYEGEPRLFLRKEAFFCDALE